ncbi:LCP family protein [Kitasatospora arboriphila]
MDGAGALKYVRARHVDGSSDLGRMHRQQRFVAQLLRQATAQDVMLDPARLGTVLGSALKAVKADKGLSTSALLDFASGSRTSPRPPPTSRPCRCPTSTTRSPGGGRRCCGTPRPRRRCSTPSGRGSR